jgi:hypothetical protein
VAETFAPSLSRELPCEPAGGPRINARRSTPHAFGRTLRAQAIKVMSPVSTDHRASVRSRHIPEHCRTSTQSCARRRTPSPRPTSAAAPARPSSDDGARPLGRDPGARGHPADQPRELARREPLIWPTRRCSDLAPTVTSGELSANVRGKIAVDHRIIGARISVDPLGTTIKSFEHASLPQHSLHILLGFRVRGDSVVKIDGCLTGIVGRDRHGDIPSITIEQISKVPNAAPDVLSRIEWVEHPEGRGCSRHQLHETAGSFPGDGRGIEPRFDSDYCLDQNRVDVVLKRYLANVLGILAPRGIRSRKPSQGCSRCAPHTSVSRILGDIREVNDPVSINEAGCARRRQVNRLRGSHTHRDSE